MALTIRAPVHSEITIKKSRFIGCVQPVRNRADAQEIVGRLWSEHPDARHICWALLAAGQSAAVDDGEPSGTAGLPMLEVLRRQKLEGVLATVIRYFGGIKLGAGGLVRAYTDTVARALSGAEKIPLLRMQTLCCEIPYALEGVLRREVENTGAELLSVEHGTEVALHIRLPHSNAATFTARIHDLSQGRARWKNPEKDG